MDERSLELENEKMEKILSESTDDLEIFRVYREFWDKYLNDCTKWGKDGELIIDYSKCSHRYIQKILESDAMVTYCKYELRTSRDFYKTYYALFSDADSEKSLETAGKVSDAMRDLILEDNKNMKVDNKVLAKLYDELIVCYLFSTELTGKEVDDRTWESINKFYNNLAEDLHFFDTKFYRECWLKKKDSDEKIYNVFPIKSKEEYEEKLSQFKFDRNGMVNDPIKYDHTLGEYLLYYGEDVPYEEKEKYLHIMCKNAYKGAFYATQTAKYFNNTLCGNEILENNPLLVMNDIMRNYKKSYYTVVCLDNPMYRKIFKQMKNNYKDYVKDLGRYGENAVELVRNLIESDGAHTFTRRYNVSPSFKNINDVIDVEEFVRGTFGIMGLLPQNFNDDKLNDDTVHEDGLTNFDYADIALSLMAKRNEYRGIKEIELEETKELYERYGRDIYDSRAMRQIVKKLIETASKYKGEYADKEIKEECVKFVKYISRKPGFNLFSDKECSDIVQIAKRKDDSFARILESEIANGMNENSDYNMSLDEAYDYANRFIYNIGNRPINKELEQEFEEFLRALSIIKINDENGLVLQEFDEFIIRQSLMDNSILNSSEAKYESIFERAVENLYLNRGENQNEDKALLYFVCNVDDYRYYYKGADCIIRIDRKGIIHSLLEDPRFSKQEQKDNIAPYVSQYVDLDSITADVLGKVEALKYEKDDLIEEKEVSEERDFNEER